jgi:hypothetical protein
VKRQLGRPRRRGKDNTKMELDGTGCKGVLIFIRLRIGTSSGLY